jgi:hypothetical protein
VHPNDIDNPAAPCPARTVRRGLISDTDANPAADVYGYTITLPSTINTFYVQYNQGANSVTVNGDMNTAAASGTSSTWRSPHRHALRGERHQRDDRGRELRPASLLTRARATTTSTWTTFWPASRSSINGEEGNDFIQLSPVTGDIDNRHPLEPDRQRRNRHRHDPGQRHQRPVGADTYTITAPSITFGSRVVSYSLTESIDLLGSPQRHRLQHRLDRPRLHDKHPVQRLCG